MTAIASEVPMKKPVILVAEGDEALQQQLKAYLLRHQYADSQAQDARMINEVVHTGKLNLVILFPVSADLAQMFANGRGIDNPGPGMPIILIVSKSSEDLSIDTLKREVNHCFEAPASVEELLVSIRRCLLKISPCRLQGPVSPPSESDTNAKIIGNSQVMSQVCSYLMKIAAVDSNVLITGETGTGKELVARMIHKYSSRQAKPFFSFNCAAIPDSLLESELFGHEKGAFTGAYSHYPGKLKLAEGGSVLLDEIGDLSAYAQAKMLRVIESKEVHSLGGKKGARVDVRFIAATNRELEQLVAENKFRKDLYYRLNIARIHLPPLRDRKEDLPQLFSYYIQKLNRQYGQEVEGLAEDALNCLFYHDWPGNIRELKNLLEVVFINCQSQRITLEDLPEHYVRQWRYDKDPALKERELLLATLLSTKWNKSRAAKKLNWSRMTLYRKMLKYQVIESNSLKFLDNPGE